MQAYRSYTILVHVLYVKGGSIVKCSVRPGTMFIERTEGSIGYKIASNTNKCAYRLYEMASEMVLKIRMIQQLQRCSCVVRIAHSTRSTSIPSRAINANSRLSTLFSLICDTATRNVTDCIGRQMASLSHVLRRLTDIDPTNVCIHIIDSLHIQSDYAYQSLQVRAVIATNRASHNGQTSTI
jgi:hypothetical protein